MGTKAIQQFHVDDYQKLQNTNTWIQPLVQ